MIKRILMIVMLAVLSLIFFISCKSPIVPYVSPTIHDVVPLDDENNVLLDEPISFEIESYGRSVFKVYIYLSETPSFLDAVPIQLNPVSCRYIPDSGWNSDKTYYWKVKIVEETGDTLTKTYNFTTLTQAQYAIKLIAPLNDAIDVSNDTNLQWTFEQSERAISTDYLVYVSEKEADVPVVDPIITDNDFYKPTTEWNFDTDYYWMIKAVSKSDHELVYATSVINHFKTKSVQPGYPEIELISPFDGQETVQYQTPVKWQGVPFNPSDQLQYKVYIADSLNDLDHIQPIITYDEEYLPNNGWKKGTRYFWKVQAYEGDNSSTAGPRDFVTEPKTEYDPEIRLIYPESDQQNVKLASPLTYVATASEQNSSTMFFRIYIANTLQGLDQAIPIVIYDQSYLPPHGWDQLKEYFWKVEVVQGDYFDYDGPRKFETENVDPSKPQIALSYPAYGSENISAQASITWNATPVFSGDTLIYEVYYADSVEQLKQVDPVITDKKSYLPSGGWGKGKRVFWKVTVNENANSNESAVWDFSTEDKSHNDPDIRLKTPENNAQNVSVRDFLTWEGIPGTSGDTLEYNLYIAYSRTELDYVTPIHVLDEQYRPVNGWEYDKRFYWKCEIIEGDKKAISEIRDFVTESKPSDIPSVELISPENRAGDVLRNEQLEWHGTPAVAGETLTYKLYYAKSLSDLDKAIPYETSEEYFLPQGGWEYETKYYWKCVVLEGDKSNVSEIRYFTVKDADPSDPSVDLLSPENDAEDVSRKESMKWQGTPGSMGGALSYKLYYAKTLKDLYDVVPVELDTEDYLPSGGWEYATTYYWKCEVLEEDGNNVSDIYKFTTQSRSPYDPEIVLSAPSDGEQSVDSSQNLEWQGTPGISGDILDYNVYYAHSLSELADATPVHTSNEYYLPAGGWDSDKDYYWKCEVIEGESSDISDIWNFHTRSDEPEKPEISLVSPETGRTNFELDGGLTWNATGTEGDEELRYTLYLGNSPESLNEQINLSSKYYRPSSNWNELTQYYWKVKVMQGDRFNESDTWNFKTGRGAEFEISLESPASGTLNEDIHTALTWIATENVNTSATPVYYVYIADSPEQLSYVHPYETRDLSFMIPSGRWEYNEIYYWKVEGYDGTYRAFDGPSVFTTRAGEVVSPSVDLLQPSSDELDVDPARSFRWKGHASYVRAPLDYEVYIAKNEADLYTTSPVATFTGTEIYIPEDDLDISTTYYWRVKVVQGTLTGDATSSFRTRGPVYEIPEIVLLTPGNGATGVALDAELTWEASGSESRNINNRASSIEYIVYIADNLASLTNAEYLYEVKIADENQKHYKPSSDWEVERSYVWTVEIIYSVDFIPVTSNVADPYSFTTRGLLPATPSDDSLMPQDDKTDVSIYTQLDWGINLTSETSTPTYFEIYLDTSPNPTTMVGTSAFTSWQPSRLSTGTDYYWKVISVNSLGTAVGEEWHFKTRADTLSKTTDVFVKDNYLYAAEQENGFSVYKIPSSPATPLELKANVSLNSLVNGVTVNGNYLFASIGSSGVEIYNIDNPENPSHVKTVDDNGFCITSEILGNHLYLANGFNGSTVDISDINNPDNIGKIDTSNEASGSAIDLVVDTLGLNTVVYIADGQNGLTVADVTVPSTPLTVATSVLILVDGVESVGIDKNNEYLYIVNLTRSENESELTDANNGLIIVNSLQLQSPIVSRINTPGFSKDVFVSGSYTYIADGKNGLVIIDCSNPALPVMKYSTNALGITANAVFAVGSTVYVAADENGIVSVDCSNPVSPQIIH